MTGGHAWQGGMREGHAWQGVCVTGGACMAGGMHGTCETKLDSNFQE